jgi:P4 family phage/plasmid primase-like protien
MDWMHTVKGLPTAVEANLACSKYLEDGFSIVHWEPDSRSITEGKGKGPKLGAWQTTEFGLPSENGGVTQVGLKVGIQIQDGPNRGLWLCCVDIDDPGIQNLADIRLPHTGMQGGKEATPRSHKFYLTDQPMNSFSWTGNRSDGVNGAVLEIFGVTRQGTVGHQIVVAPSAHFKSGSRYVWEAYGRPQITTCKLLFDACRDLASGVAAGRLSSGSDLPPEWQPPKTSAVTSRIVDRITETATAVSNISAPGKEPGQEYRPSEAVLCGRDLDEGTIRRLISDCTGRCAVLEGGARQYGLNRLVLVTASVLAGGNAPETAFDDLRNAVADLADKMPPPAVSAKVWVNTIDRAIRDGRRKPRRRAGLRKYPLTVQGLADLLVDEWRDHYRYVFTRKEWLRWNGLIWERVPNTEQLLRDMIHILRWAQVEASRDPDPSFREDAVKWYYRCESNDAPSGAEKLLRSEERRGSGMGLQPSDLDVDPWLFVCANGYFDMRTGRLCEPDPDNYMTMQSTFRYLPGPSDAELEALCPRFMSHIRWVFEPEGPEDAAFATAYLASWLGYAMSGSNQEQKLLILHGPGCNGKSALLEVVFAVSGDYAVKVAKEVLLKSKSESRNSDELAALENKRWGYRSEADANDFLSEGRIKDLTGSSTVRAMRKFQKEFTFEMRCTLFLDTNHQPKIHGRDEATLRRLKMLPFYNRVTKEMMVKDWWKLVIRDEGDAVLTWLLRQAYAYFQRGGLAPEPACVKRACAEFADDNDQIGLFLEERCEMAEAPMKSSLLCASGALYSDYNKWSKDNGRFAVGSGMLKKALESRGFVCKRTSNGNVWRGLTLKPWEDPQAALAEAQAELAGTEQAATLEARLEARRGRAEPIEPGMPGYVTPDTPG